jgi:polyketide biosynthesis enoyl-CoA hydratase PksI
MALGFTPGMGSTVALEAAFGGSLAREMLYTGRLLKGRDLAGVVGRHVVPRARVVDRAIALAEEMATAPRAALVELKRVLAQTRLATAGPAVEREREAHRRLFALAETARAIDERYPAPADGRKDRS